MIIKQLIWREVGVLCLQNRHLDGMRRGQGSLHKKLLLSRDIPIMGPEQSIDIAILITAECELEVVLIEKCEYSSLCQVVE